MLVKQGHLTAPATAHTYATVPASASAPASTAAPVTTTTPVYIAVIAQDVAD